MKTSIILRYLLAIGCFVSYVGISYGQFISEEQKLEVIGAIGGAISKEHTYVSKNPVFHDANQYVQLWKEIWNTSKHDAKYGTFKQATKNATNRPEFQKGINGILAGFCSHFRIDPAKWKVKNELSKYTELGFSFSFSVLGSGDDRYVVTHLDPKGLAVQRGIQIGDAFYLSNQKAEDSMFKVECMDGRNAKVRWNIPFYRIGSDRKEHFITNLVYEGPYKSFPSTSWKKEYEAAFADKPQFISNSLHIEIPSFADMEGSLRQQFKSYDGRVIAAKINYAMRHQLDSIIIDLRGNTGGYGYNVAHLLSYFIDKGKPFAVSIDRKALEAYRATSEYSQHTIIDNKLIDSVSESFYAGLANYIQANREDLVYRVLHSQPQFKGKVQILVDRRTGCAAELAAYNLRKYLGEERCVIIGTKTAGVFLSTLLGPSKVVHGFDIVFVAADMLLPDGRRIEGQPLEPDIDVQKCQIASLEEQVNKGWAWLSRRLAQK